MKKIYKILFTLCLMVIGIKNINASTAKCTYDVVNNYPLVCNLTEKKAPDCKFKGKNPGVKIDLNSNFSNTDFQNTKKGTWLCPSKIYYTVTSIASNRTITYSNFSFKKNNKTDNSAKLNKSKSSYGNKFSSSESKNPENSTDDIVYCKYGSLTLKLNKTKKEITPENEPCQNTAFNINYSDIKKVSVETNGCPKSIYLNKGTNSQNKQTYCTYNIVSFVGATEVKYNGDDPIFDASGNDVSGNTEVDPNREYLNGCTDLGETLTLLKQIYTFLRYMIPVLIIVLSIVDFIKVVASGDDKNYKTAYNRFIKRIIVGIVILLLPFILSLLIRISGIATDTGIDTSSYKTLFCIFE